MTDPTPFINIFCWSIVSFIPDAILDPNLFKEFLSDFEFLSDLANFKSEAVKEPFLSFFPSGLTFHDINLLNETYPEDFNYVDKLKLVIEEFVE